MKAATFSHQFLLTTVFSLSLSGIVHAQEAASTDAASADATSAIATAAASADAAATVTAAADAGGAPTEAESDRFEIVVTAQKREQRLNDVPMSINAISGNELIDRGIARPSDLEKVVPGFTYTVSGYQTPVYILRGVGYFESSLAADPAVSVYVDEVSLPFSAMTTGAALDLERVEVLKGPQGILFGRNSTGGAINYIAAKPTDTFGAGFDASYQRFGQVTLGGYVTGSLTDTLSARLAVKTEQGGDWQRSYTRDDSLGKRNMLMGRILLDWKPTDALAIELNVNGWLDKSDNQAPQLFALIPKVPANVFRHPATFAYPLAPHKARAADWNPGRSLANDNSFWQVSLRGDYDLSAGMTLTSITSYADYSRYSPIDQDGMTLSNVDSIDDGSIRSFFQELRLSGDSDTFNWVVGANYERDRIHERLTSFLGNGTGGRIAGVDYNGIFAENTQISETYAAFANAEYEIIPSFKLQGGLRYTKNNRHFNGCGGDIGDGRVAAAFMALQAALKGSPAAVVPIAPGACSTLNAQLNPDRLIDDFNQDNVSWRAGVTWDAAEDVLVYANVSKGYKAGGYPTTTAAVLAQFVPVSQENVLAYEAGFKAPLFNRAVQLNGALFWMDYTDKQVRGIVPDPVLRTLQALVNVPKSRVAGAEIQLQSQPIDGLSLNVSGTYLDTNVGNFTGLDVLGATRNFKGSRLPYTPKWQAVADARYEWDVSETLLASVSGHLTYHSATNAQLGNAPQVAIDSYVLLDLGAGVETKDGKWRFSLFGENVTNKYYWNSANSIADVVVRYAGRPATYGVRLGYRY